MVVIGVTYGVLLGVITNYLLFRTVERNIARGQEPIISIGGLFFARYIIDGLGLLTFALIVRDAPGTVAAAVAITVSVKITLLRYYLRKGGKIG